MLASHKMSARHVDHGGDGAGEVDNVAAGCPACHPKSARELLDDVDHPTHLQAEVSLGGFFGRRLSS